MNVQRVKMAMVACWCAVAVVFLMTCALGRRWMQGHKEAFVSPVDAPAPDFDRNISKACEHTRDPSARGGANYPMPTASNDELQLTNAGHDGEAWRRHPVHASMPMDFLVKYPRATYYELDNCGYEAALKRLFVDPHCRYVHMAADTSQWGPRLDPHVTGADHQGAYRAAVDYTTARLQRVHEGEPLALPDSGPIQVVHDRWLSLRAHRDLPRAFLFEAELVLYRESKFHGKHVHMTFLVRRGNLPSDVWEARVVSLSVVGTVFEDHIGMHPTTPRDPDATRFMHYDPNPLRADTPVIMDDALVLSIMKQTKQRMRAQLESTLATA